MTFCSNCATRINEGVGFCGNCGTAVGAVSAETTAPPPEAQHAPPPETQYAPPPETQYVPPPEMQYVHTPETQYAPHPGGQYAPHPHMRPAPDKKSGTPYIIAAAVLVAVVAIGFFLLSGNNERARDRNVAGEINSRVPYGANLRTTPATQPADAPPPAPPPATPPATPPAAPAPQPPADAAPEPALPPPRGAPHIAFIPRSVGMPWWDYVRDFGVMPWAEANGIDVIYAGPVGVTAEEQIAIINDLIAQGIDFLLMAPNDTAAMEAIAAEARAAGVVVITHEAAGMQNIDFNVEAFDNAGMGAFLMDQLASMMGYEGYYVTMVSGMFNEFHNAWADAAVARQLEAYPNMTLVPTGRVSSESATEVAYQRAMELFQRYPELRGILGTGSFDGPGSSRAIRDAGLTGEVFAISVAIPSEISEFLHAGIMKAGALWDPAIVAQAMLNLAMAIWNGEYVVTGMNLGVPGYESVVVTGTLVVGNGAIAITTDNVDDFPF